MLTVILIILGIVLYGAGAFITHFFIRVMNSMTGDDGHFDTYDVICVVLWPIAVTILLIGKLTGHDFI